MSMTKRINRKKQRRNLTILALKTLLLICLVAGGISHLTKKQSPTVSKKKTEEKTTKKVSTKTLKKYKVDESGNIPIMMYHGIHDLKNSETAYTGGNVDVDGYQRTAEAFRKDLEFYYENDYRMVRLQDYIHGDIDAELGKSPLCLTFDDGLDNNILVTGKDKKGNLKLDPNCAVAILEEFKEKYPDFHVTATFFVNGGLFSQPEYNEDILHWLIDHGYDIGNHTYSHVDFTTTDAATAQEEVGSVYALLEEIIPGEYVSIVALPFGSPYKFDHPMIPYIQNGTYEGKEYHTESMLQVAWEADYSPFHKQFNPAFLKRIRAYDNNGENFDIQMNFETLQTTRYISDGDPDTITIPKDQKDSLGNTYDKKVKTY